MPKEKELLKDLPTRVEDGVTLYNIAREGGLPWWVDEEKATQILKDRDKT